VLWWVAFNASWRFHVFLYPSHAGQRAMFWTSGLPFWTFLPGFLMVIPALFPSLTWSMIVTNAFLHQLPPVRRAFDREAIGYPGTDYRSAQGSLLVVALILSAGWAVLAILGAATLVSLG